MRTAIILTVLTLASSLPLQAQTTAPVVMKDVVYSSPDGKKLVFDFTRPAGDGPFALVVCVHGGGWRAGSHKDNQELQQRLAMLGFATASVQYRFTPQYQFPAQLDDVMAAIDFLADHKEKFKIDPQRVGLIGGSAGGHLSLLAGFAPSDKHTIKAIVNMSGPTDLRTFKATASGDRALKQASSRTSAGLLKDLLGTDDRQSEICAQASPITHIRKDGPPVLTIHGTNDDIVPFAQAEELHTALKAIGARGTLIPIKGGDHSLAGGPPEGVKNAMLATVAFFSEHLRK